MSCPNWIDLVEQRDLALEAPSGSLDAPVSGDGASERVSGQHSVDSGTPREDSWQSALKHLDGCAECHERAIAADPSLLFSLESTRPSLNLSPAALADEAEAMRRAVTTMRRTEHLKVTGVRSTRVRSVTSGRAASLSGARFRSLRAAAIVAGVVAAGGLASNSLRTPQLDFAVPAVSTSAQLSGMTTDRAESSNSIDQPVFEPLEMPDANYYEVEGENTTFVMLVGESFEDIQVGPAAGS